MVFPLVHYEYDSMGRLYKVSTGAGTSSSKVMQEMSYTPQGWLSCNDYVRGTSAIYGERLTYANSYAGFVTQREDAPGETTHYTYDYAGRLIREKVGKAAYTDYLYDTRSNLLSISQGGIVTEEYAYSGDRLSSLDLGAGAHSFEYDSRGRIISDYTPNGGHGIKYNNYLNKVSGTEFINYSYLANGFKTSSLIHGIEDTRDLIYRGPFIFRQKPDRTWGMESVEVAEGKLTDGVALIYLKDHLGSVTKVVNANTGEVVESSDYTSYGKRASPTSSEYGDKFTGVTLRAHFAGKEDQKADFYVDYTDFGARHYSPVLRRWLTPDPLSEKYYGISPYAYCAGNPVNYIDPDGTRNLPLYDYFMDWHLKVDSWYGPRTPPKDGASSFHKGLDFNYSGGGDTDKGSPILATHEGTVRVCDNNKSSAGRYVVITSSNKLIRTKYFHLDSVNVKNGQHVDDSFIIGTMGGSANGSDNGCVSHLHYEIWVYNGSKWVSINPSDDCSNTIGSIIDPQLLIDGESKPINGGVLKPAKKSAEL